VQASKWPVLRGNQALNISLIGLLFYTVLLPVQPLFPPITSAISLYWLFYVLSFTKHRLWLIPKNPLALLWFAYYAMVILGLLYTSNPHEGGKDVVLKISLFLWPLGISSWPELVEKHRGTVLIVFAYTTVASSMYVVAWGVWRWLQSGQGAEHLHSFTDVYTWIPNHYMALFVSFSILIFLQRMMDGLLKRWIGIAAICLLLIFLGIVGVRIQFVALPMAIIAFFIVYKNKKSVARNIVGGISALLVLLVVVMFLVPSSRKRALETIDEIQSARGIEKQKQTNHRVYIWQYGWQVVKKNMWLGTGTGAADDHLNEALKNCDAQFWNGERMYSFSENNYNYHNSILQHWATHGLVGLILFLALFLGPFILFRGEISAIGAAFLVLCFVAFFTESMLERQAGVLFFGYFYAVFFASRADRKKLSSV
jgi:O-antigen ligase